MKLVCLAVSLIAAFVVDCHSQPGPDSQHSIIAEQPQMPDLTFESEDSEDDDSEEGTSNTVEPPPEHGFTLGYDDSKEATSNTFEPPLGPGFTLGHEFDIEEEEEQSESELRGSSCKAKLPCSIEGGYCVASKARCYGRRVSDGCKGSCDCCIPGCSEKLGFFSPTGSKQCFMLFKDKGRNWTDATTLCRSKGLVMAHPYDPVTLRSYLVMRYGYASYPWLNARGSGSYMRWQDNGQPIRKTYNPLWWPGQPRNVSSSYCMLMWAYDYYWKLYPNQTYYAYPCYYRLYTLCELKLK